MRGLLEGLDSSLSRLVRMRTRIGAAAGTVRRAEEGAESSALAGRARRSRLEDADAAETFSDLTRQRSALRASYQAGRESLNQDLLRFLD